jgi:hypothetical protein
MRDPLLRCKAGHFGQAEPTRPRTRCRDFHKACHNRAAEDRAALISAREEADGKLFFSKFVAALRQPMFGFSPSPGLLCDSTETEPSNTGTPLVNRLAHIDVEAWSKGRASGKSFVVVPWLREHGEKKVFNARLYGPNGDSVTYWEMSRVGEEDLRLKIEGHNKHAGTAMAVLAAACLHDLEGAPTASRSPLTSRCVLNVCAVGDLSVRELGDFLAPLRYRAESVTVADHSNVNVPPLRFGRRPRDWPFRGFIVDIKKL